MTPRPEKLSKIESLILAWWYDYRGKLAILGMGVFIGWFIWGLR